MKVPTDDYTPEGDKNSLNSELWHACAGPLVYLPGIGSHVVYFPQGHSEQVSISTNREVDAQIPNYPSLPPQLICQLHNVVMHADPETDEVYAQMTLQPLSTEEQNRISFLAADLVSGSKQPTNYFCKILTASDTSTHGGFSVPRRAAEKVFLPLDFSQQPPTQELVARDLHDNVWKFKHIFRGQPKRHLLTTGWSVFVTAKRLVAGDSVIFIWNAKNQLFIGIRRANRPQTIMPSSVLSSDSMHLGLLAAAAHAAATNTRFTVFYNPRASPSEFVIPVTKYLKAVHHTRISVGMRFRMLFETDESSVRRYMGTLTGISDLDPVKWPNSHWRSVKVSWDESAAGEKQPRVSLWEIEALNTFPMYPSSFPLRLRRFSSLRGMKMDDMGLTSSPFWLWDEAMYQGMGMGLNPWIQPPLIRASDLGFQNDMHQTMATAAAIQEARAAEPPKHMLPSLMQLQQSHALNGQSADFVEPQMSDHFLQSLSGVQPHASVDVFPQQSVHQRPLSFTNTAMQLRQGYNQQPPAIQHFADTCQKVVSSVESPPISNYQVEFEAIHQSLSHAISGMVDSVSPMEGLLRGYSDASSKSLPSYSCRPSKRIALDPLLSVQQQQQQQQQHIDQNTVCLPPFPCVGGDHCLADGVGNDPQNNILFGVNMSSDKVFGTCSSSYMSSSSSPGVACSSSLNLNPIGSSCIDDSSGFLLCPESSTRLDRNNFVKVYKSGSPGRSVDICRLRSYEELRREVGRMFGLEVQLEDPLRSGWQLVFVDRENDLLLLGDDPYQEFVKSVWCIKILSPQEVQEMGQLINQMEKERKTNFIFQLPNTKTAVWGGSDI